MEDEKGKILHYITTIQRRIIEESRVIKKGMSLPSSCPLCGADKAEQTVVTSHVYGAERYSKRAFFKCAKCDVIYQYPGLTKEEEEKFYNKEFEKYMSTRSGDDAGWLRTEEHIEKNEEKKYEE